MPLHRLVPWARHQCHSGARGAGADSLVCPIVSTGAIKKSVGPTHALVPRRVDEFGAVGHAAYSSFGQLMPLNCLRQLNLASACLVSRVRFLCPAVSVW